jgi:hypothetical protein
MSDRHFLPGPRKKESFYILRERPFGQDLRVLSGIYELLNSANNSRTLEEDFEPHVR